MHLKEFKESGHAPSLVAAFLHFDISFMIWVILGALMPFLVADPALTGPCLQVTPTAAVGPGGPVTLIIKTPETPNTHTVTLLLKPGDPGIATRQSVKPLEKFSLDVPDPRTIAAINLHSNLIRLQVAPGATSNPNEIVAPLKTAAALLADGKSFQVIANGYPASVKLGLVGLPLLAAGFWRILLGVLADRFGSKRVGTVSMLLTLVPLLVGWKLASSFGSLQIVGFLLGVAGASFAVSLPLASRWYPPRLQGVALGIAGAGNSGTVLATLLAPMLARTYGWHAVLGLLTIPVLLTLIAFALLAKDPPGSLSPKTVPEYLMVLRNADCWWFCLLYFVTFGGFVGMSSFFNSFFVDQYDAPKATVGLWTAPFIIAGSLLRPLGGWLADRLGGIRMLTLLYGVVVVCAAGVGVCIHSFPTAAFLLFVMMGALGMGNGSVFQLVPQRFRKEIGVITGLVGAAGGVGGYYLNFVLGHLKDITGTYASGYYAFAVIAVVALAALVFVGPRWTRTWLGRGGKALEEPGFMQELESAEVYESEAAALSVKR